MREYGFSWIRILPYKNKICDFVLIRENTGHWKPVFSHILCSKLHWNNVIYALLLTLNKFKILLWCFHCWLWVGKHLLGKFWRGFWDDSYFGEYVKHKLRISPYLVRMWKNPYQKNSKYGYFSCSDINAKVGKVLLYQQLSKRKWSLTAAHFLISF